MNVIVFMNRPLLDIPSSRSVFLNGLAQVAKGSSVTMTLALPSLRNPIGIEVGLAPMLPSASGYSRYPLFIKRLSSFSKNYLRSHPDSIIHQFLAIDRGLDSFSIPALGGLIGECPFIMGPAEIPHQFDLDDFGLYMNRTHSVAGIEFQILKSLNSRFIVNIFRSLFASSIDKCDYLIVAYDEAIDYYRRYAPLKKIKVISYGVDIDRFAYSNPPKKQDVLFVGNLIERKGVKYLLEAFSRIHEEYPNARLRIVGDGPQRFRLESTSKQLGIERKVTFLGTIAGGMLLKEYANCRVLCHPSLSEGFCHVNLEAMACGRPVVTTNTNGSSMVVNGQTGFLIPVADAEHLSEKLAILLGDYELAQEFGKRARQGVESRYTWTRVAKQYLSLYESLA